MNPQPPVTKMRIDALSSSGVAPARGETAVSLQQRLAQVDWTPWLILGFGALLRFLLLGIKPPHFDEGINGWFVDQMSRTGFYRYDPTNYHGPLHFYVLFLCQTLLGRNVWALRLPVVLVSIGAIYATLKFEPLVGRNTSRVAALAMAVSPGMIFYGRYSIHEVWLLLFSILFVLGLLGLWKLGTRGYLWCAGMGLAGMILTKETYIIHLGCAIIAAGVLWVSHMLTPLQDVKPARQQWNLADLAVVVAVGVFFVVFFYSGTFFHWSGVKGIYQTFATWYKTGSHGNGHEKPWPYWLELILRYEWPVLVGLLLCFACQYFGNFSIRYLAIYGVGVLFAYSIVRYKTPWCIISIAWPFLFLFGAGATARKIRAAPFWSIIGALIGFALGFPISYFFQQEAVRTTCSLSTYLAESFNVTLAAAGVTPVCGDIGHWLFGSACVCALIGAGGGLVIGHFTAALSQQSMETIRALAASIALAVSLVMSISLNYFHCTTDTEPYVYVQTYNDIYKLMNPVMALVKKDQKYYSMTGHFIRSSTYPFPWLLGDFPNVGYYEHGNMPGKLDADFLLVEQDKIEQVEKRLHDHYYTEPLTIRPYQDGSKLYLNARTFRKLYPGRAADFVGKPAAASGPVR